MHTIAFYSKNIYTIKTHFIVLTVHLDRERLIMLKTNKNRVCLASIFIFVFLALVAAGGCGGSGGGNKL